MLLDIPAADNGHSWHICHMTKGNKWMPLPFPPACGVEWPQANNNK